MYLYLVAQALQFVDTVFLYGVWLLPWLFELYQEGPAAWNEEQAVRPAPGALDVELDGRQVQELLHQLDGPLLDGGLRPHGSLKIGMARP